MKLIAENIHVISKITKEAFLNRDEIYKKFNDKNYKNKSQLD